MSVLADKSSKGGKPSDYVSDTYRETSRTSSFVNSRKGLNKYSTEFMPLSSTSSTTYAPSVPSVDGFCTGGFDESIWQPMGTTDSSIYNESDTVASTLLPTTSLAEASHSLIASCFGPPPGYVSLEDASCADQGECDVISSVGAEDNNFLAPTYSWSSSQCNNPNRPPPIPFHLGFKLFVGALPYQVTESDLFPLFSQYGSILELHIQRDYMGRSKGCAWLRYSAKEECDSAIEALHNNYYLGSMNRPMQLTYASDNNGSMVGGDKRNRTRSDMAPSTVTAPFSAMTAGSMSSSCSSSAASTTASAGNRPRASTSDNCFVMNNQKTIDTSSVCQENKSSSQSVLDILRFMNSKRGGTTNECFGRSSVGSSGTTFQSDNIDFGDTPSNQNSADPGTVDPRSVYVSGLPISITDNGIYELFAQFGSIKRCDIKRNASNGIPYPLDARITYEFVQDANRARDTVNGVTLPGNTTDTTVSVI